MGVSSPAAIAFLKGYTFFLSEVIYWCVGYLDKLLIICEINADVLHCAFTPADWEERVVQMDSLPLKWISNLNMFANYKARWCSPLGSMKIPFKIVSLCTLPPLQFDLKI